MSYAQTKDTQNEKEKYIIYKKGGGFHGLLLESLI